MQEKRIYSTRFISIDTLTAFAIVREMKRETTTIRICKKLHKRIKKHLKNEGVKIENWTERKLTAALSETEMPT